MRVKVVCLLEQGEKTAVQQGAQENEDELRQDKLYPLIYTDL